MSDVVYRVCSLLEQVLVSVPMGTNLGLFYLLWSVLSGRLLAARGAVVPALSDLGLPASAVRRSIAALEYGRWKISSLLQGWGKAVAAQDCFRPHSYEGVRPVACDLVGFFRQRLSGNVGKHYTSQAGKALPAVSLAMVSAVGSVGKVRFALPRLLMPAAHTEKEIEKESDLQRRAVRDAAAGLAPDEALIVDAGFCLGDVRSTGAPFVARVSKNFTARRNLLPEYKGRGRHPEYGEVVRPVGRKRAGHGIADTPPDATETWEDGKHTLHAHIYLNLVAPDQKVSDNAAPFCCVVIFDRRYAEPWVLASNLSVSAQALWRLYRDRWAIEQLPLAAKQMLGAERAFVFGKDSRFRLPQLALLAGSILTYVAATSATTVTGFWDRAARPTCGRLRRAFSKLHFSELSAPNGQLREKRSVTDHLPKGVDAHRRQKPIANSRIAAPAA